MWDLMFFINSILFAIGLAMDAFTVSLANGLSAPCMSKKKALGISGTFGIFQAIMPLIGWICVHTIIQWFTILEKFIPYIALSLLLYIGGKMLYEGIKNKAEIHQCAKLGFFGLMVQGIATSIDALSVGFTIADFEFIQAFVEVIIIGIITFVLCFIGIEIGKKFGAQISNKATIFGGIILIIIGIEIFLKGIGVLNY